MLKTFSIRDLKQCCSSWGNCVNDWPAVQLQKVANCAQRRWWQFETTVLGTSEDSLSTLCTSLLSVIWVNFTQLHQGYFDHSLHNASSDAFSVPCRSDWGYSGHVVRITTENTEHLSAAPRRTLGYWRYFEHPVLSLAPLCTSLCWG